MDKSYFVRWRLKGAQSWRTRQFTLGEGWTKANVQRVIALYQFKSERFASKIEISEITEIKLASEVTERDVITMTGWESPMLVTSVSSDELTGELVITGRYWDKRGKRFTRNKAEVIPRTTSEQFDVVTNDNLFPRPKRA
jgi:hypothetical protein